MKLEKRLKGRDSLRLIGRAARFISTSIISASISAVAVARTTNNMNGVLMEPYSLDQGDFQVIRDCPPNVSDYMSLFTWDGEFRTDDFPHSGIDFGTTDYGGYGVRVKAAAPGIVTRAGYLNDVAGYRVAIFHGYNSTTGKYVISSYSHLDRNIPVTKGQIVFEGETIGQVGSSGNTTSAMLHFGAWESDTRYFSSQRMVSPHKYWWQEKPGERINSSTF